MSVGGIGEGKGPSLESNFEHLKSLLDKGFLEDFEKELVSIEKGLKSTSVPDKISRPLLAMSSFFVDEIIPKKPSLSEKDLKKLFKKLGPLIDSILEKFK